MSRRENLLNQAFGKWLVLALLSNTKMRGAQWLCRCSCGHEQRVSAANLKHGQSKGCRSCFVAAKVRTHGMADTSMKEYRQWRDMRQRCNSPSHKLFPYYGGRGIKICGEWDDFARFHSDMGKCPAGMTLERINNDSDYSPDNCQWAPWGVQARNKRSNVWLTAYGKRMIRTDWAKTIGISPRAISKRQSQGWPDERIIHFYLKGKEIAA